MKYKTKDALKWALRENYKSICKQYAMELSKMWDMPFRDCFWIGDEVGGTYDYAGECAINMEDIIFCVENDVTIETFHAWQEYYLRAHEYGFTTPNLKSWVAGCPRVENAVFDKLDGLKADLQKAIDEEKNKF